MVTAPRIGGSARAPGRSCTPSGASSTDAMRSPEAAAIASIGMTSPTRRIGANSCVR